MDWFCWTCVPLAPGLKEHMLYSSVYQMKPVYHRKILPVAVFVSKKFTGLYKLNCKKIKCESDYTFFNSRNECALWSHMDHNDFKFGLIEKHTFV